MIQIKNLVKNYKINNQFVPVLKGLNCTIQEGEFVAILGPSGCGKSTLLNVIAGLTKADGGQIIVDGKETEKYTDIQWDNWRKNQIGIIFQNFHLIPHLSALENVELAMSVAAYDRRERRKRAKELLCRVGLKDRMKHKPGELSGGQKQRVAIARAIANHPQILLADEPTGALDSATSKEIMELLHSLNQREGITIIMVTHDEEIASQTERNIRILDGEIQEDIYLESCRNSGKVSEKDESISDKEQSGKKADKMKFMDAVSMAFHNVGTKKRRSALTVWGISIGIFSVVIMMGVTNGISGKVESELGSVSNASIVRVITEDQDEDKITELKGKLKQTEGIEEIQDTYILSGTLAYKKEFSETDVISYQEGQKEEDLLYGAYPSNDGEIVVTEKTAEQFVGKGKTRELLGKTITVYVAYSTKSSVAYAVEKSCTVVGITSVNLFGNGNNYITFSYAEKISAESVGQEIGPQRTYAYLEDNAKRSEIISEIQKLDFTVASSEELIHTINSWVDAIKKFLMLITAISLAVAVVMVIIVQYMSVAERTKEIGILRAIGAKKQDVRNIFLMEAGIIGTAAGVLGITVAGACGMIINNVIHELMKENAFELYQINSLVLFGCLAVGVILCLMAGYMPARQAASVDTIEVLK